MIVLLSFSHFEFIDYFIEITLSKFNPGIVCKGDRLFSG